MGRKLGNGRSRFASVSKLRLDEFLTVEKLQPIAVTLLVLILYAVGLKWLFIPALVAVSVWRLPMPRIFTSWLGRIVVATLLTMGLLQIAACLQFLLLPKSGFVLVASITWILHVAVWLIAPMRPSQKITLVSTNDICGLIVALAFLLPFSPIITGQSSILRIAEVGSLQAIDGTNHYAYIAGETQVQHFDYASNYYYPKGFHITVSFIQNTFFRSQYGLGWRGNAMLYFGDYLLYGSVLGYILYFLCISWLKSIKEKLIPDGWAWSKLLVAVCLAPPLAILYLLPFMSEAFLNYYYVCITFACGVLFLNEIRLSSKNKEDSLDLSKSTHEGWSLLAYLILMFGASATWPLLIPPFAFCGAMFLLPSRLNWRVFAKRVLTLNGLPIVVAFMLQLLPIYFQLKYSSFGTSQSLNLTGGLFQYHPYVLLVGSILVFIMVVRSETEEFFRRHLINVFMPLFAFLGLFMLYQYFTTGSILYYAIKVSLLIEILLLVFGIANLVAVFSASKLYEARYAWLLPTLPLFIMLLLVSDVANPLKDVRDLFRAHSNDIVPQYLTQDVNTNVRLGSEGKIKHFNLTELHYNFAQGKFFTDMQVPYWADMMQYDASKQDFLAVGCIGKVYNNLSFGDYSQASQRSLVVVLKKCAMAARKRGETFYVVTDPASAPYVHNILGSLTTIVID